MFKYVLFGVIFFTHLNAQTIDKKKILEIIKAAKQHKSLPKIDKSKLIKRVTPSKPKPKPKPIIVYRKRKIPTIYKKKDIRINTSLANIHYGTLPNIAPSSVALRRKFKLDKKPKQNEVLFKSPQQNKNNKINTRATKIKYF